MGSNKKQAVVVFVVALGFALLVAATALWLFNASRQDSPPPAADNSQNTPMAAPLPQEMRAMWVSYFEWQRFDISTEAGLRTACQTMFENCSDLGLNTVIVAVRPFADAMYPSDVYPWSHLLTGTQGVDPGYNPLTVMIEEAHRLDLRFEAWINPYRIEVSGIGPNALAKNHPAVQNPDWARFINGGWFDPGLPEVQQLVVQGVEEIVRDYDVDGIHFDDYFYPEFSAEQKEAGEDTAFDAASYQKHSGGAERAAWRRSNVDAMVQAVYGAIKAIKPHVSFGISPQGNNENNYTIQYSDVAKWLEQPGYADYIMPQLYWGFDYRLANGRDDYAFETVSRHWADYPRHESVTLYAGLGAYRIGEGDGSAADQKEWYSGHNVADMVASLRKTEGYSGFALFRYDSLYNAENAYAEAERAAIKKVLAV